MISERLVILVLHEINYASFYYGIISVRLRMEKLQNTEQSRKL